MPFNTVYTPKKQKFLTSEHQEIKYLSSKARKPKKPTFEEVLTSFKREEDTININQKPITKTDVYGYFHSVKPTSRSGGGTEHKAVTFNRFPDGSLGKYAHTVNLFGDIESKKMYALCHFALTVSKVPLGNHVLGK